MIDLSWVLIYILNSKSIEMAINTTFNMNASANIVNYLKDKCTKSNLNLTQDQIEKKLMNG